MFSFNRSFKIQVSKIGDRFHHVLNAWLSFRTVSDRKEETTWLLRQCFVLSYSNIYSVHWGINPPSKTPPPCFSRSSLLNLRTVQSPLFLVNSPWKLDFSVNPHNIKIVYPQPPSHILKVAKFLGKILSLNSTLKPPSKHWGPVKPPFLKTW